MDMDQATLVTAHKAILNKAAEKFIEANDDAHKRHLDLAAADLGRMAPEAALAEMTVAGDVDTYDAPADMVRPVALLWGERERNLPPWDPRFPGRLPALSAITVAGVRKLRLSPAPTFDQVAQLGSTALFTYHIEFKIGATVQDTTVPERHSHVLLTLSAAFAMQELANRGVFEPMKVGDGFGVQAKNGTPAALAKQLRETAEGMIA